MRIYFNSSFSCGKTTLKNWCASYYNLKKVPEIFRTIIAEREINDLSLLRSNVDLLTEIQIETLNRQFEYEKQMGDNFAACRSIDTLAFFILFGDKEKVREILNSPFIIEYTSWLKEKDVHTFLIKPEKELLKSDGIRDTNWNLSMEIYGLVKGILTFYQIPYVLIEGTNMSERQNLVRRIVK